MSSIINALLGHGDHGEKKCHSTSVHTVKHEDVKVKSVVSSQFQLKATASDSQSKIHALMSKLGSTHTQIDEYSRRRTDEISGAVKSSIEQIVQLTVTKQQELLDHAHKETQKIEEDHKQRLLK